MEKIEDVLSYQKIHREKLHYILKNEANHILLQDIMKASFFLINDARYVQESYRKEYIKAYTHALS